MGRKILFSIRPRLSVNVVGGVHEVVMTLSKKVQLSPQTSRVYVRGEAKADNISTRFGDAEV